MLKILSLILIISGYTILLFGFVKLKSHEIYLFIYFVLNVSVSVPKSLYRSFDKYHRFNLFEISYRVIENGLIFALLLNSHLPTNIAAMMLLFKVAYVILVEYDIYTLSKWKLLVYNDIFEVSKLKIVFRPTLNSFVANLSQNVSNSILIPMINMQLGAQYVVQFTSLREYLGAAKQGVGVMSNAVWADLSNDFGRGLFVRLRKQLWFYTKLSLYGNFLFVVLCLVFFERVYLHLLDDISLNRGLMNSFLVANTIYVFYNMYHTMLLASNKNSGQAIYQLMGSSFLILSAYLSGIFGDNLLNVGIVVVELIILIYVIKGNILLFLKDE